MLIWNGGFDSCPAQGATFLHATLFQRRVATSCDDDLRVALIEEMNRTRSFYTWPVAAGQQTGTETSNE